MRKFVSANQEISSWNDLEPYFENLLNRDISTFEGFKKWLSNSSELEAFISENLAWRYIRMTINTNDRNASDAYSFFITEIQPKIAPVSNQLEKKLVGSDFAEKMNEKGFDIYLRRVKNSIELFREENIPLQTEANQLAQEYGKISGSMSISYEGEELTMQQAAKFLHENDRKIREKVYHLITNRRLEDRQKLDDLFSKMVALRHQIAINAGFENFRDYMFAELGRFDYSVEDCKNFHQSVSTQIVPIVKQFHEKRRKALNLDKLRPFDMDVATDGGEPLKPFTDGKDLTQKSIQLFGEIHPFYAECLSKMNEMGHLDLDSKQGKAPGGYNYPLYETGYPFIFMNAAGLQRDLITMIHEGGHAVHSILTKDLPLTGYKNLPSEVAELASMSMELISMKHWYILFNEVEFAKAKKEHLEDVIKMLPWIALIDEFQHWIYTNPNHSIKERTKSWVELQKKYNTGIVDYTGYEDYFASAWHRQLHLFEVPFYYIEYGIAQLGAIGVWENYLAEGQKALKKYNTALSLGYTASIPEIYAAAGVKFDFSETNIKTLADFVQKQL
ncbi:MAG: M3 family oligoendopeptidase [Flavobacteriales bacterium]